jgi:hypothetical protein
MMQEYTHSELVHFGIVGAEAGARVETELKVGGQCS